MDCGNRPECSEIADRAVKKTFAILGVDIDKPESVEEFRQDLRFGKRLQDCRPRRFQMTKIVIGGTKKPFHGFRQESKQCQLDMRQQRLLEMHYQ